MFAPIQDAPKFTHEYPKSFHFLEFEPKNSLFGRALETQKV